MPANGAFIGDSYGLEIVSRVLNDVEAAEAEFETILSALKGDSLSLHGVTSNEHCAVHVHVGRENLGFTLPTLQHLAYLLVVYEHEIEKIHPATQREGSSSADTDTRSNRDSFMVTRYEIQMVLRNGVYERREVQSVPYDTLADVRRRIFEAEGSTLEGLIKLISPAKGYVVNFTYLNTPGRPKTIEFRAHAGCLDTEEIRYWVMFVMGLVRLANHYAQTGGSCPVTEWNNHISFWDLLEDMKFPPSGVEHLKAKAAYNVEWPPKPRLIPEDYTPPASDDSHRAGDNSLGNDQLGKHTPENNSRDNDNQSGAGNGEGPSGQYGTSTQDQSGAPENPPRKGKGTGYHKDSSLEGVREFEAIIQKSYGKIFTPTTGLLCGARALATSLEAVRREAGHTQSPTDQELLSIINGDKHNTLKTARKESMLAGMCSQGAVSEEARKELEDLLDEEFDATNNLTATQLAFALEVVNQLQGQNYRLGICEEREGKHQVYINASDESGGVGPVIWVHNDRYEQVEKEARLKEGEERSESPEPISHWSGIAPGGSPIIETPEDEVLDFANSSINTGSIIGRSPEHGATGSEKRKRDDEDEGETEPSKKIQR